MRKPENERVLDFATLSADPWFGEEESLSWPEAISLLGVSRSTLRRALDASRQASPGRPLVVHGLCAGQHFKAVRRQARRGIPWRFVIQAPGGDPGARISNLRRAVAAPGEGRPGGAVLARLVAVPLRWFRGRAGKAAG